MTPKIVLRQFKPSPAEYEAIVHVYNSANPHTQESADSWQHWDQHRDPIRLFTRYVAEHQGDIIGYGYSSRSDTKTDNFRFAIFLNPDWETAGLIADFYGFIMRRLLDHQPVSLFCQTKENESTKINWLETQGFKPVMRYPISFLELDEFDPLRFKSPESIQAEQGCEIISLAELADRSPDWQRQVYEFEMLLAQDVPSPTGFIPPPFERYARTIFQDPGFLPHLSFVALDGRDLVGITNLHQSGKTIEYLESGLTGVHREYRRRGLATALKVHALKLARDLGARYVRTTNEENNPMFQLNLRLGFQEQPAEIDWEKVL